LSHYSGSGRFLEYVLERKDVQEKWHEHVKHAFVAGLADSSLPISAFKYYLVQDYLFLVSTDSSASVNRLTSQIQFARAHALAAYKAKTMEDIVAASLSRIVL